MARTHADFVGVQPYTRFLVDDKGIAAPPAGAEITDAGYEFYPQAVADMIRWAHAAIGKPIYVTENGIATDDDARRIAFIDKRWRPARLPRRRHSGAQLSVLVAARQFRVDVGLFSKHFGLVAVDLQTFKRTPKPSALHLGAIARANHG